MSNKAITWVTEHSPLRGADYLLHVLVADSVSDECGFWMSPSKLALKARVSRSTAVHFLWHTALDAGLLALVEDNSRKHNPKTGQRGQPSLFRFLYPDVPEVFDPHRPGGVPASGDRSRDDDAASGDRSRPRAEAARVSQVVDPKKDRTQEFEEFWNEYPHPRREGKADARRKWDRALRQVDAETILAGLRRRKVAWERDETRPNYIPLPATWLHQGRWDFELTPESNGHDPRLEMPRNLGNLDPMGRPRG